MFATKIPTLKELIGKIWIIPADFAYRDFSFFFKEDNLKDLGISVDDLKNLGISKDTKFKDIVRWNDGKHMDVQREYTETDIAKKVKDIKDFAEKANGDASWDIIYVNEFNICPLCAKGFF